MNELSTKPVPEQKFSTYPALSKALKNGDKLHGFRSGGGLRVVRLTHCEKTGGYGEHPHVETALKYAEDDLKVGGRKYNDFYGKTVDHYLTGDSFASSQLDAYLLQGRDFDVYFENDQFIFLGKYYYTVKIPQEILDKAEKTRINQTWTSDQGIIYEIVPSKVIATNSLSFSIHAISNPTKIHPHFQEVVIVNRAKTLSKLFKNFVNPD